MKKKKLKAKLARTKKKLARAELFIEELKVAPKSALVEAVMALPMSPGDGLEEPGQPQPQVAASMAASS